MTLREDFASTDATGKAEAPNDNGPSITPAKSRADIFDMNFISCFQ
jgi:hypothetical protein